MKKEYDFRKGERGKFFRPSAELNMPVYLDSDVAGIVEQFAKKEKTTVGQVVNDWLRKDIQALSASRKAKVQ